RVPSRRSRRLFRLVTGFLSSRSLKSRSLKPLPRARGGRGLRLYGCRGSGDRGFTHGNGARGAQRVAIEFASEDHFVAPGFQKGEAGLVHARAARGCGEARAGAAGARNLEVRILCCALGRSRAHGDAPNELDLLPDARLRTRWFNHDADPPTRGGSLRSRRGL